MWLMWVLVFPAFFLPSIKENNDDNKTLLPLHSISAGLLFPPTRRFGKEGNTSTSHVTPDADWMRNAECNQSVRLVAALLRRRRPVTDLTSLASRNQCKERNAVPFGVLVSSLCRSGEFLFSDQLRGFVWEVGNPPPSSLCRASHNCFTMAVAAQVAPREAVWCGAGTGEEMDG